jgi:hypothetical protein
MMRIAFVALIALGLVGCQRSGTQGATVTKHEVAGHAAVTMRSAEMSLTHVDLGPAGSLILMEQKPSDGIDTKCLSCKISKVTECANEVCPPIKAQDPNASCSDAITECTKEKCKTDCKQNVIIYMSRPLDSFYVPKKGGTQ